ncbi:MAG: DUF6498-containing protein [archaeon]
MKLPKEIMSSVCVLLAVNLLSLFGVLFLGWNSTLLLLAYWFESAIIGFYAIIKIIMAQKINPKISNSFKQGIKSNPQVKIHPKAQLILNNLMKVIMVPFFIIHFGMFMMVHLFFIIFFLAMPGFHAEGPQVINGLLTVIFLIISLFVSHTYSFFTNFIGKKEYLKISPGDAMGQPYPRVIIMHVAIIVGIFLSIALQGILVGSNFSESAFNLCQAVVLIILKTFFDVKLHTKEHKKLED